MDIVFQADLLEVLIDLAYNIFFGQEGFITGNKVIIEEYLIGDWFIVGMQFAHIVGNDGGEHELGVIVFILSKK